MSETNSRECESNRAASKHFFLYSASSVMSLFAVFTAIFLFGYVTLAIFNLITLNDRFFLSIAVLGTGFYAAKWSILFALMIKDADKGAVK